MGPSASDVERRTLDTQRALLPDGLLTWAWANLTFIDEAGWAPMGEGALNG